MTDETDRISAGELRAMGCTIDEKIPDCATVPRTAIVFGKVRTMSIEDNTMKAKIDVFVNAPFHWVEAEFAITPDGVEVKK